MSRTSDDIRMLLAQKFQRESARLKSWGTKTDEKAAVSFADAVTEFVKSLMCESRYRELKRIAMVLSKQPSHGDTHKIWAHVEERLQATKAMSKAIRDFAIVKEGKRAWKQKVHKQKHKEKKHGRSH